MQVNAVITGGQREQAFHCASPMCRRRVKGAPILGVGGILDVQVKKQIQRDEAASPSQA